MKPFVVSRLLAAACAAFFIFTAAGRAKVTADAANATPPAAAASATPAVAPTAPVDPATPAVPATPEAPAPLRRLDQPANTVAAADSSVTPAAEAGDSGSRRSRHSPNGERVAVGHDATLDQGEKAQSVVAIFGSATSAGEVADAVVSILGNTRVTGPVGNSAVAVLGNTYVNSRVGGEVVAVLGNVELGPDADVGGEVVAVGGKVIRDPKAVVRGSVQNVAVGPVFTGRGVERLSAWFRECLLYGRMLGFGHNLGWAWGIALALLVFYVVLGLMFGRGVDRCVATLETSPGRSLLASLLSVLLLPVLIVLLCITVVGIAAVPFVVVGLMLAGLFGKAVILAWLGRRITRVFGDSFLNSAAVAVLVGGVLTLVLYAIPFVGMLTYKLFNFLGLGVVVYTLMQGMKREKPPAAPAAPAAPTPSPASPAVIPPVASAAPAVAPMAAAAEPTTAGYPAVSPGFGTAAETVSPTLPAPPSGSEGVPVSSFAPPAAPPPVASPLPPPPRAAAAPTPVPAVDFTTLPRAGFWLRTGALFLDVVLVIAVTSFTSGILPGSWGVHSPTGMLPILALYGAAMWKSKGTTIGGVVCGLKVVRTDGREIDWPIAAIRALGCFLSLIVGGLGFIWVVFDEDKQSWHDKIAGTAVVRVPKGTALI